MDTIFLNPTVMRLRSLVHSSPLINFEMNAPRVNQQPLFV